MTDDTEPRFDVRVPDNGYRWWYVDALSDDGRYGVVVIAFIGSVFSPYYYRARARGDGRPENHCAINVATYGPGVRRWAMTERPAEALQRDTSMLRIGPSHMHWHKGRLDIQFDERSAPFGRPVTGRLRLAPAPLNSEAFALDRHARHHWRPVAPLARARFVMTNAGSAWTGDAYFDTNYGSEPLESAFTGWNWSRSISGHGTHVNYNVTGRDGVVSQLALRFGRNGTMQRQCPCTTQSLPRTGWRMTRESSSDGNAQVQETLEDTPFYARSLLRVDSGSESVLTMHEQLSLERFRAAWVRTLLPFRMPRNTWSHRR